MADRVLLGKNDASDVGLWVSKPGVGVTYLAGNTYLKSFDDWYGTHWEFNGPGDNTVGFPGQHGENGWLDTTNIHAGLKHLVEGFNSGLFKPNFGSLGDGGNHQYFKKTSNGTILWSGGARFLGDPAPKMYTPNEVDGSGNPTKNAFIGSDYPIIEVRARRLPLIDVSQSGTDPPGPMTGTGVTAGLGFVPTRPTDMRVTFRTVPIGTGGAGTLGHSETVGLFKPIPGSYKVSFPDSELADDTPGEWKILEWDMSNVQGWSDPWAFNGFPAAGPFSSSYRITQLGFKFTAAPGGGVSPTFWDSWFDPMWEIDYVRVKRKGVPKAAGPYGNYQDSLIFDSDMKHTGLVHQTGIVTIGTAKAYIDGTTSDKVVGHNTDADANGYVSFPELDYIPLVLFQRIDENVDVTGSSYPGGEDEFSICTQNWEDHRYPTIDQNTSDASYKGFDIQTLGPVDITVGNPSWRPNEALYHFFDRFSPAAPPGDFPAIWENFMSRTIQNPAGLNSLTEETVLAGNGWPNPGTCYAYRQGRHSGHPGQDALISGQVEKWGGGHSGWAQSINSPTPLIGIIWPYASQLDPGMGTLGVPGALGGGNIPPFGVGASWPTNSLGSRTPFLGGEIPSPSKRAGRRFSDMIESFSEVRTFAYARAKKDGFWLTCRNAIAQEGMEPALNLAPVFPEEGTANQGFSAYTSMQFKNDNGAWGMFHPALALYDNNKFSEGLELSWDTVTTANSDLLNKVGMDEEGNIYEQYKWWPNFSCSGLPFNGRLARPNAPPPDHGSGGFHDLNDPDAYPTSYVPYTSPPSGNISNDDPLLATTLGVYDAVYTTNGILKGDTGGFYPYRHQSNKWIHCHDPFNEAVSKWNYTNFQYNIKRLSSAGIFHPSGIVHENEEAFTNKNVSAAGNMIQNQTAYLGGALNKKNAGPSASYDKSKIHPPKYKYWVLRVPVSIPEFS